MNARSPASSSTCWASACVGRLAQYQVGGCDLESADESGSLVNHAIEIKRYRRITQGMVSRWWTQTCAQAGEREPVLWYRGDGEDWCIRCRMAVEGVMVEPVLTPAAWATLVRERMTRLTR